jgi:hypothetical protein
VDVEAIEVDGKHFIVTRANGRTTKQEGPFADAAAAQAAADRHMRRWRKTAEGNGTVHEHSPKSTSRKKPGKQLDAKMDDATGLSASFINNDAFVSDMARFASGDLAEKAIRKKYRLAESDWIALAENDELVRKIEDESTRRLRDGSTARERAQVHFATAPNVLGGILNDGNANARHRIESAKELRAIAVPAGQAAGSDNNRFEIKIILNADVETYNKSRSIMVDDPEDISTKSTVIDANNVDTNIDLAIIAANKRTDGGNGGQPI